MMFGFMGGRPCSSSYRQGYVYTESLYTFLFPGHLHFLSLKGLSKIQVPLQNKRMLEKIHTYDNVIRIKLRLCVYMV